MLSFFGQNIVASEGEQWKKYRKISAPAFSDVRAMMLLLRIVPDVASQRNNRLVWDETVNIMMDLFSTIWKDKDSVAVDHCLDITLPVRYCFSNPSLSSNPATQIALFVIGIAGKHLGLLPRDVNLNLHVRLWPQDILDRRNSDRSRRPPDDFQGCPECCLRKFVHQAYVSKLGHGLYFEAPEG